MSNCSTCPSSGTCSIGGKDDDGLPPGMLQCYNLNQSTAEGNLVWIETVPTADGYAIADASAEVLGKLRGYDTRLFGVLIGGNGLKGLYDAAFSFGVNTLYHVKEAALSEYHPEAYCDALADVVNRVNPAGVVLGGTARGMEIAPRLAATLAAGLVSDCVDLSMDGREMTFVKSSFGGRSVAEAVCTTFPQMATMRPGALPVPEPEAGRKGTVIYRSMKDADLKGIVRSDEAGIERPAKRATFILGSEIGEGSIAVAERIAAATGAIVMCTPALAEAGSMPSDRVFDGIADTGVLFGISGADADFVRSCVMNRMVVVSADPETNVGQSADRLIIGDTGRILAEIDRKLGS